MHTMNDSDFSYYNNLRPEMTTFIQGAPNSILEIGCGAGRFRDNFKDDIDITLPMFLKCFNRIN